MLHLLELKLSENDHYVDQLKDPNSVESLEDVTPTLKAVAKAAIKLGTDLYMSLEGNPSKYGVTGAMRLSSLRDRIASFNEAVGQLPYLKKISDPTWAMSVKAEKLLPILKKVIKEELEYFEKRSNDGSLFRDTKSVDRLDEILKYGTFLRSINKEQPKPNELTKKFYDDLYSRYNWTRNEFLNNSLYREPDEEWFIIDIYEDLAAL